MSGFAAVSQTAGFLEQHIKGLSFDDFPTGGGWLVWTDLSQRDYLYVWMQKSPWCCG